MVATTSSCHFLEKRRRVPYSATRKSANEGSSVTSCILARSLARPSASGGCGFVLRKYTSFTIARTGISNKIVCSHGPSISIRSEEHTSELQSRGHIVCRLLLEKKHNK